MKARNISWLVGVMTIAMIVVIGVQLSWLQSTATLRQEVFDRSVDQSLQQFASWLSREELDTDPENNPVFIQDVYTLQSDGFAESFKLIRLWTESARSYWNG